jgi:2-methylcitrate dehydratase PrpD
VTTVVQGSLEAAVAAGAALDADEQALAAAQRVTADVVAVALVGSRLPGQAALTVRLAEPATGFASAPANVVADAQWSASPHLAALLNGTAAVALELDEVLLGGGHPGSHVVPAALAEAQRSGADGRTLLEAVARGYETAARLHRARKMIPPSHPHGAIGAIGAAVAVATLRRRDPLIAARAAATLPLLPTWAACLEGASARNAWVGLGALTGLLANDLADSGFTGVAGNPLEPLERVSDAIDFPAGGEPLILRSGLRAHAVVSPLQSAIEAALELAHPTAVPDAVRVETVESNRKFDYLPQPNDLSARFSLPHAVAVALTVSPGPPTVSDFGYDPSVLPLAERVEVAVADDLQAQWPATTSARVTVTSGGETRTVQVDVPLGHPDRPLSDEQHAVRIRALTCRPRLAERLLSLRDRGDVRELLAAEDAA